MLHSDERGFWARFAARWGRSAAAKALTVSAGALAALLLVTGGAAFYYRGINPRLNHELGEPLPSASAFLTRGGSARYIDFPAKAETEEGDYTLTIQTGGRRRNVALIVRDTTAPSAENAGLHILPGETVKPGDVLKNVNDASAVSCAWEQEPELREPGVHSCAVRLTDACGNETVVAATVQVADVAAALDYVIGEDRPAASDFVTGWEGSVAFLTDMSGIDWHSAATVPVELSLGDRNVHSALRILDETPPKLTLRLLPVEAGAEIDAESLVESCEDDSPVTFRFASEPDLSLCGYQTVTVIAADSAGNETRANGSILVCSCFLEQEAGRKALRGRDLISRLGAEYADYTLADGDEYIPDTLGYNLLTLTGPEGETRTLGLLVRDTTPPTAKTPEALCFIGYSYPPESFLDKVEDATAVKAEFVTEPDWNGEGPVTVPLLLTDEAGNTALLEGKARLIRDTKPPEISGAKDRYYYVGDAVSYFQGVRAWDNIDPDCALEVDKSAVDYRTEGSYPVIYTATDRDGNTATVRVMFSFSTQDVTDGEMRELSETIFSEILTDGMSLCEQAEAVYNYLEKNMYYTAYSDKRDWKTNVYKGLTTHMGDCYTYCYTARFLLTELGVDTVVVQRDSAYTRHFWLLVNLGTGWYHWDWQSIAPQGYRNFMRTTAEIHAVPDGSRYWGFDPELYPEVAAEPFEPF